MSSADPMFDAKSKMQQASEVKEEDKLYRYKGVLYPSILCPEDYLKAVEQFQAREDDIILVAYPKCGFNWTVVVVRKIINEATGMNMEDKLPPLMEFFGPDAIKVVDKAPSPRFLGTHMEPQNFSPSFHAKKAKMLVVFRNPKDTLVSYYHFFNNNPVLPSGLSWDSFFSNFMSGEVPWGSYFDHALAWEKRMDEPNVMIVTYEEMKQDLSKSIKEVSSFFGFSLTDAQVQRVAEGSTFKVMKESSAIGHALGDILFRKGEVGDWKNHFTQEQSKQMDEAFNKHLAGTRLGAKLNYQKHCQ